jgi:hypothetical protein
VERRSENPRTDYEGELKMFRKRKAVGTTVAAAAVAAVVGEREGRVEMERG